mgnify:FL=1|tara:strand:+ start:673 stop:1254 length:582 start_codon:yes stop_codon:yes gene_type:complete
MKKFSVNKISYCQSSKGYTIHLQEIGSVNYFSILIGNSEAQSVALALEGVQTPRPTTHDIIIDILDSSDIKINRIEINNFKNDVFFSRILLKSYNFGIKSIDCKPSDAISIALKCNQPIFIDDEVLYSIKKSQVMIDSDFNAISEYYKDTKSDTLQKKSNVNRLTRALNNAVSKENYEVAAKIRDKIKLIKDA